MDFFSSSYESILFIKYTNTGHIILSLYVVDMVIIGDDVDVILVLKVELAKQYEMKDLGPLRYFWVSR